MERRDRGGGAFQHEQVPAGGELRERLADMTAQRDRACRQRLQPEAPPARVLWQMPANGSADIVHRLTAAIALLRWGNLGMSDIALLRGLDK